MAALVSDYLRALLKRPFVWGEHDCILAMCDWGLLKHGQDPALRFRGTYSTELGAARIIARAGGLLNLVDTEMQSFGFRRLDVAAPEAMCLIDIPGIGLMGAVAVTETMRATISAGRGAVVVNAPVVAAWDL